MVKLPRDIKGAELARRLGKLGYTVTRQSGSHIIRNKTVRITFACPHMLQFKLEH